MVMMMMMMVIISNAERKTEIQGTGTATKKRL